MNSIFKNKHLTPLKIFLGIYLIGLNSEASAQDTNSFSRDIKLKGDTLEFDIYMEETDEVKNLEKVEVLCYYSGPRLVQDNCRPRFAKSELEKLGFINSNLNYPKIAKTNKIEGYIHMQIFVDSIGVITEIIVLEGLGYGIDEEAKRIVRLMPDLKPAKKNGEPIAGDFRYTILFKLPKD